MLCIGDSELIYLRLQPPFRKHNVILQNQRVSGKTAKKTARNKTMFYVQRQVVLSIQSRYPKQIFTRNIQKYTFEN